MGTEAVAFLEAFVPEHTDIFSPSFSYARCTRMALLHRWRGQVKRAMEIGVGKGVYSQYILSVLEPEHLVLVDSWDTHDPNYRNARRQDASYAFTLTRFAKEIKEGRVTVYKGESEAVVPTLPESYFDYAFVDGDHRTPSVLTDLELCYRVIKPGGIISGHDFSRTFGVPKAVAEFCRCNAWKVSCLTPGPPSTFVLSKS